MCKATKARNDIDNLIKIFVLLTLKKKINGKTERTKQECGSPSLQPSLRCHTLALFLYIDFLVFLEKKNG